MSQETQTITKVGLAVIRGGRLLVVRKRDSSTFILPGGRPEGTEVDEQTLSRELAEELTTQIVPKSLRYLGIFGDRAANEPNKFVEVRLYLGEILEPLATASEIEELRWFAPDSDSDTILAASIRNKILPHLREQHLL